MMVVFAMRGSFWPTIAGALVALLILGACVYFFGFGEPISNSQAKIESVESSNFSRSNNEPGIWLYIVALAAIMTSLISVSVSFYLYRWRKILISDTRYTIPEELGGWIQGLDKSTQTVFLEIQKSTQNLSQIGSQTHDRVNSMIETFMSLHGALDAREKEIERLKKGYDSEVFRKFLNRFLRVDQTIEDYQREGMADQDGLSQIRAVLEDALAECGVERFEPELMIDYRTASGVSDRPKTEPTTSPEDAFKISEVIEPGYRMKAASGFEYLLPAKVRVLEFVENGDGE